MEFIKTKFNDLKTFLGEKHQELKNKTYSWGNITTVGIVTFVVGLIIGNMIK